MKTLRQIYELSVRECKIFLHNPIYGFCLLVFPIMVMLFFTTVLGEGSPLEMPVGIVDLDNTSTTRSLIRRLDGLQNSRVVAYYTSPAEARRAIQENEIYAFLYFPKGTTQKLLSARQPKMSYYYSNTTMVAGSMLFRDLKTVATLGSAAVGQATMRAKGFTDRQIQTFLQPIAIDLHQLNNPTGDYNNYISTVMVPGIMMLFILLLTAYALGTELKFKHSKELVHMGGDRIWVSLIGKLLPHTMIWLTLGFIYSYYVFGVLDFPHQGGTLKIVLLNVMMVLSAQGFGVFAFGLLPSLRMSMSVCSLWAVLSISMAGSAFPIIGMDPPLQSLSWLFPLRHYYMFYQMCVLNGYGFLDAWWHVAALVAFILLPMPLMSKLKNAMLTYVYIP